MSDRTHESGSPPAPANDLLQQIGTLRKPLAGNVRLSEIIDPLVKEGELYEKLPNNTVRCYACGHDCIIRSGRRGICQIRYNLDGTLLVPWGYVAGLQCDPTEKKPFFHVYPGSDALTFGMLGCDLHCSYCQNWDTSQALRDAAAGIRPTEVTPEQIIELARRHNAKCVTSSYNEPLITSEWAMAIFKLARQAGFTCMYVSNGNATREVLEYIRPYTDGFKVDLKTMNDRNYRKLGTTLNRVLDGIKLAHKMGFWVELVTLIVPGFNDSDEELREAARFIESVSADIPWHVTAFYKNYKMRDPANTSPAKLMRAAEIGYAEGLHFVYAGNAPGRVGRFENTFCPGCKKLLIQRYGYLIQDYRISDRGTCASCDAAIPGIWPESKKEVRLSTDGDMFVRAPRIAW